MPISHPVKTTVGMDRKSQNHRFSGRRLERKYANRAIVYNGPSSDTSTGQRSRGADVSSEESDTSNSQDWSNEDFRVSGRDDVEGMSHMLRSLGLPGPAQLGIARDMWDAAIKHTPLASPAGANVYPRGTEDTDNFTFVPEPDPRVLQQRRPSFISALFTSPSETVVQSPREPARLSPPPQDGDARGRPFRRSPSSDASPRPPRDIDVRGRMVKGVPESCDAATPGDNEGRVRRGKGVPEFQVKQTVAQAHRDKADAAAVSSFIHLHGGEDVSQPGFLPRYLDRSGTLPTLGHGSKHVADRVDEPRIARALSEPVLASPSRTREASVLREAKTVEGPGVLHSSGEVDARNVTSVDQTSVQQDSAVPNPATTEAVPEVTEPSSRSNVPRAPFSIAIQGTTDSFQKKRQQAETEARKQEPRPDVNRSLVSGPLPIPTLKPPPGMNILKSRQGEFSTHDMLDSLAPDCQDLAGILSSDEEVEPSATDGLADDESGETDGGADSVIAQEESTRPIETGPSVTTKIAQDEHNDRPTGVDNVVLREAHNALTVGVPDLELEQLDLTAVGQNPDSELKEVARPSYEAVGPKYPWVKGSLLGSGSFGTVYEAFDSDGMFFAVKEVSLVEQDKQAQQSISQLMQEIELLSQFKHDNIVQYLGTDRADGKLYIFLEYVSKGSLASVCKSFKLSDSQISAYTRQILKGLKYLHDQNIVHRDIKCANILVDTKGICKLADFGMAKQISSLDQTKSCKGSAYWMAPEVIDPKKTYGNPADIWSLGCSILEMATGAPPFGEMEWYRVLWTVGHGNAPPIPESLSDRAKDFVKLCLEVNASRRPSATELLDHPFVRQAGGLTPTSSGPLTLQVGMRNLQSISEEKSTDLSSSRSSQANGTVANGQSDTTSS